MARTTLEITTRALRMIGVLDHTEAADAAQKAQASEVLTDLNAEYALGIADLDAVANSSADALSAFLAGHIAPHYGVAGPNTSPS